MTRQEILKENLKTFDDTEFIEFQKEDSCKRFKEAILKSMDEYAEQEVLAFQHFTEFKMSDDDWLDEKGDLKSMQDVWKMYKKQTP